MVEHLNMQPMQGAMHIAANLHQLATPISDLDEKRDKNNVHGVQIWIDYSFQLTQMCTLTVDRR